MLTRKTQYAWMSLGGLICLFGLVLACKIRDGNKASAQPELLPPPTKITKKWEEKPSQPKATLEMPMPSEPLPPPTLDTKATPPSPLLLPPISGPVLPASFAPNTPTTPQPKTFKEPLPPPSPPPPPSVSPALTSSAKPLNPIPSPVLAIPPAAPQATIPLEKPAGSVKKSDTSPSPSWNAPSIVIPASAPPASEHSDRDSAKTQPGEPPLAPSPGPVQLYHVHSAETLTDIARHTLGSSERSSELHKLNPTLKPDEKLRPGTTVRLPVDACVQIDDAERVRPLPALRPKPQAPKAKTLPLTGTYQCSVDEKNQLTLPRAIRDQLNGSDTVLLSPGPDKCLWLTNQPHLERLGERLDQSQANEADVRVFKRLYFAQTEKLSVNGDGRVTIPERLGQFAGLHQEVVLVGIDDHFEVWDAARWRSYTRLKSGGHSGSLSEQE
ncbi:MAG: hypothetical protein ACYC3I_28180 [Gemmataceae bacterium]